jgi:ABC-type antimicrobial peptide transport system permease subunit
MSSSSPDRAATGIGEQLPSATVTVARDTGGTSIVGAASIALWIGAIGTSVFAIIALIAAVIALLRRRGAETFALRALGLRASQQAALRRRELGIVGLIALIIGVVVGAAVSLLVATTMAQLSTPTAPAALMVRLEFDPLSLVATLVILLIAFLACWIGYGAAERRRAVGSRA